MQHSRKRCRPKLRFSPTAWAKLLFLRDAGPTEVGAFGISAPDDLLLVHDLVLVPQQTSWASVSMCDTGIAQYFDDQIDAGRHPTQFARIWVHTHPDRSAHPSQTDETTFARSFGTCDWSVMMILARQGATYARLQLQQGLGLQIRLDVEIDYSVPFAGTDQEAWAAEYAANVAPEEVLPRHKMRRSTWSLTAGLEPDWLETQEHFEFEEEFHHG